MYEMMYVLLGFCFGCITMWLLVMYDMTKTDTVSEKTYEMSEEQEMTKQEMIDYLLSTGLYGVYSKRHPELSLYHEIRMMETDKTVPIRELVERFIKIDKYYNGKSWNIMQILSNIDMIVPVEDRKENEC